MTLLSFNVGQISAQRGDRCMAKDRRASNRYGRRHVPTLSVTTGWKEQSIDCLEPKVLFILHIPVNYV